MADVLIIGGGLAGTASALALADNGHSSIIVEARSRLGGRAHSRDWNNSGDPVEYGGGWLRADHARAIALAQRLGLDLTSRPPVLGQRHFRDGISAEFPAEDMTAHDRGMARFQADAALMDTDNPEADHLQGLTLSACFQSRALPASVQCEILAWWSISGSGAPDQISVTERLTPKVAKGLRVKIEELAFTVAGGVTGLAARAARSSGAELILGDAVERLKQSTTGIQAQLVSGRQIIAKAAVLAKPVNTLPQIRFIPPLRPQQQIIRQSGHAGAALKLLIRARGVEPGWLATGETHGLRWFWADHVLPDGTVLVIGFGLAAEIGTPDAADLAAALAAAFPGADLVDFDWHDWRADPFARGTWVSPSLATLPAYAPEHWQIQGRLAFAGSDLGSAEQGWFEGALLTAERAVADLIPLLGAGA